MDRVSGVFVVFSILTAVIVADITDCDFYDTVDLTNIPLINDSYTYKNVTIPRNKTGMYEFTFALFSGKKPAKTHRRGCLCNIAKCVLLCCEPTHDISNAYINIATRKTSVIVDTLKNYVVQTKFNQSCDSFPVNEENDKFAIRKNGNLTSKSFPRDYTKEEYCLVPVRINDTYYELRHPNILHEIKKENTITFSSVLKGASVFCLIMIISVYIYLPKFRTVYHKCCLSYFICLTINFIFTWYEQIFRDHLTNKQCYVVGYCGYYTVMAMFLWLVVINYDIWRKITRLKTTSSAMFRKYNIFVWSVAATLFAITGTIESLARYEPNKSPWRPGVGIYYCWINTESWSAMVFYFGPISIMLIIIIVFSVLTAKHLYVKNKETRSIWNTAESQTTMTNQANFDMFFRIFAISGSLWTIEIIAYIFNMKDESGLMETLFPTEKGDETVIDLFGCSSGIFLFFIIIWKQDVLELVYVSMMKGSKHKNCRAILMSENESISSSINTESRNLI